MPRLPIAFLLALTISGCASTGSTKFACGVPEGQPCRSAMQVYADTEDAGYAPVAPASRRETPRRKVVAAPDHLDLDQSANGELVLVAAEPPVLPTVTAEAPVREPARVLRIWIAPWQDRQGDLIAASHVYTEVEAPKWRFGAPEIAGPKTFRLASGSPAATPAAQPTK